MERFIKFQFNIRAQEPKPEKPTDELSHFLPSFMEKVRTRLHGTPTHFAILFHTSASEEKISFGGEVLSATEF
jgi:hypothetical protein